MKKFFFPLDTVLRYKEQVLDSLKGEHARILAKIRECENAIDELEHEYSLRAAEFQQNKMNGMKINEMHTYENYFDSLRLKIRRKQEQLARLREQEEIKRKEVVEAKKETSSIEKLKEKKREAYHKEEAKSEELFIEEFVSSTRAHAAS